MKFELMCEIEMPAPHYPGAEYDKYWQVMAHIQAADEVGFDHVRAVEHNCLEEFSHCADAAGETHSGRLWWPSGVQAQEAVRVSFNRAPAGRPSAIELSAYESGQPIEMESAAFERQGTGRWARYTGATVRIKRPEYRGRSFRWRLYGEGGDGTALTGASASARGSA